MLPAFVALRFGIGAAVAGDEAGALAGALAEGEALARPPQSWPSVNTMVDPALESRTSCGVTLRAPTSVCIDVV